MRYASNVYFLSLFFLYEVGGVTRESKWRTHSKGEREHKYVTGLKARREQTDARGEHMHACLHAL